MVDIRKKIKKFYSLQTTLTGWFLFLGLFLLLSTNLTALYFNFIYQRTAVVERRQMIAQNAANSVKNFITEKLDIIKSTIRLTDLITADPGDQELILDKMLGYEPSFRQLVLFDQELKESARASRLSSVSSGQFAEQVNDWLFSKVKTDLAEAYISPVYINKTTAEPMLMVALPIVDVLKNFQGVVVGEISLKTIWDLVGGLKIGRTGQAYVVDNQGNLIAFFDISRVLKGENLSHLKEVQDFMSGSKHTSDLDVEISAGINGSQVMTNFIALGEPDWAVMIELPVAEAYELIYRQMYIFIPIMLFGIILTIVAGVYLSKKIIGPIVNLKNAAVKIGAGDMITRIDVKGNNEIAELSQTFNSMTADLEKSRKELEDYSQNLEAKVAARTKELDLKNQDLEKFNKMAVGRELKMIELKQKIKELEEKNGK